ncbi:basic amino acid/polyamine antiporter [Ligilactobacillus sp. WILCCON 0076]|uniref:Basic amino acid/polyamine antiporter n=1 Tax=Ligilactobacillus ubinensis TaxID=2876789 RepID=A0A9X2FLB2_9LACO|nr:basic amino acid/polyamine antiporter [Ligilactobacillus ubinensis]MCP0887642.1 basic amino acid/polyamine antiporter [Ligilactobacillus ubinensis]
MKKKAKSKKLGLIPLVSIVITSALGSGIFTINTVLAKSATAGSIILAWIIVGVGILMLALSINNLALKQADLQGIFSYAQNGFGDFIGFLSGWGYWLSACLGNVAFAIILMSSFGFFSSIFKSGQNLISIVTASVILWILIFVVIRGVESAAILNTIITFCKLVPLICLIVACIYNFKFGLFNNNLWMEKGTLGGKITLYEVWNQVKTCMLTMVWVFVGIEGATTMSGRAKKKKDTGKATIIGMLSLLSLYVLASILPYGYLSRQEILSFSQPTSLYIFKEMVGDWGAPFIGIGIIISILGAWLSWTMLPAETTSIMAKNKLLPNCFAKVNRYGAPTLSLITEAIMCQIFLIIVYFSENAYNLAYSLCTSSIIVCYCLVGLYQIKISLKSKEVKNVVIGAVAAIFQLLVLCLVGLKYLLFCFVAYLPGLILFIWNRKNNKISYTKAELIGIAALIMIGIYGITLIPSFL